ncbi:MAG: ComEC/Rec2 family competence protein [Minisyncoccia bacterium]
MSRLLLLAALGFAFGILAASLLSFGWPLAGYTALLAALFLILWFRQRSVMLLATFCILAGATLGILNTEREPDTLPEPFLDIIGTKTSFSGVVVEDPDIRETTKRITVELERGGERTRFLVVTARFPEVRYGERVRIEGVPKYPEPFTTENGRVFRYDRFLAKDGIFAVVSFAHSEVIGAREGVWLHIRGALSDIKFAGITALSAALPEPHASLASGLILGGKQGLGASLLDDFIRSGLIHIVVLSGYNVMIIAEFIMKLLAGVSRRWAAALGALTIGAFVLAAGAGPASVRAGLMAGIALYGRATLRTYDAFRALVFAGVLMLLWNPRILAFDPGFQLSFIATVGLIFGAPLVERWLVWVRIKFLREIGAATLAAQIAVLPLLLYQSGLFSVVALPSNLLVLPLVPFAMLASFIALIGGMLVPFFAAVIGFPSFLLLSYIIGAVEFAAHLPLAAFTIPEFPFILVVLAYALLALLVHHLHRSSRSSRS